MYYALSLLQILQFICNTDIIEKKGGTKWRIMKKCTSCWRRKMYLLLAAKTEQALELLESDGDWRQKALHTEVLLITGMQECEEIYVQTTE